MKKEKQEEIRSRKWMLTFHNLEENGYTFPTVMDTEYQLTYQYGIRAYPTTWMIDGEGNLYGYVESAMTGEIMRDIVEQTMEAQP